ncbi:MAG TPA: hypothetical protein VFU38_03700 [Candidatus Krumholzibacteria bacterium]|nr:hypothetical protein [Candidatus Krumholzibacteria bacterium]
MTEKTSGSRLAAILWFVAAALAYTAVGIRFVRDREMNWSLAAGGLFCVVMGIAAVARNRQPPARS